MQIKVFDHASYCLLMSCTLISFSTSFKLVFTIYHLSKAIICTKVWQKSFLQYWCLNSFGQNFRTILWEVLGNTYQQLTINRQTSKIVDNDLYGANAKFHTDKIFTIKYGHSHYLSHIGNQHSRVVLRDAD